MIRIRTSRPRPIGRYVRRGVRGYGDAENFNAPLYTGPVYTPPSPGFQSLYQQEVASSVAAQSAPRVSYSTVAQQWTDAAAAAGVNQPLKTQAEINALGQRQLTQAEINTGYTAPGVVGKPGGMVQMFLPGQLPATPTNPITPGGVPTPPGGLPTLPGQQETYWKPSAPPSALPSGMNSYLVPILAVGAALILAKLL